MSFRLPYFLLSACALSSCAVAIDDQEEFDGASIDSTSQALNTNYYEWTRYDLSADEVRVGFGGGYPKTGRALESTGAFSKNIDAALRLSKNGRLYLFSGAHYVRYNLGTDTVDPGFPKRTGIDGWRGGPTSNFDAVVEHPSNGTIYFFRGSRYYRFNVRRDRFESGSRRLGIDGWRGVWKDGVDGAVFHPGNGAVYFFKGRQYIRYDLNRDAVTPGYPKNTGEAGWRGVRKDISAAYTRDNSTVEFIHPPPKPRTLEPLFNVTPGNWEKDPAIHNELIRLMDGAASGTKVWLSVPGWDRLDLADAMARAIERGVDIKAITHQRQYGDLDWWERSEAVHNRLSAYEKDHLRTWHRGGSYDPGAEELGFTSINHAKVALFENTSTRGKHVSVLSSSNWRGMDQVRQNDALILQSEPVYAELEETLERIWALASGDPAIDLDRHKFGRTFEIDRDLQIYLTPSPNGGHTARDPHLELLDDVVCGWYFIPLGPWGSPGSRPMWKPRRVWVAGSTWGNHGRGSDVMSRLEDLKEDGCDVRIIGGLRMNEHHETAQGIFDRAERAGIPWVKTRTHSKYILVDAPLWSRSLQQTKTVVAGALNFDSGIGPGAMLETGYTLYGDSAVHGAYEENWLDLCETGSDSSAGDPCAP